MIIDFEASHSNSSSVMPDLSYAPVRQEEDTDEGELIQARCQTVRLRLADLYEKLLNRKEAVVSIVACAIILIVTGTSVGLGLYALLVVKPESRVDLSLKAFAIPDHPAWQRFDAWNNAFRGHRARRSVEEKSEFHVEHRLRRSGESCGNWQTVPRERIQIIYLAEGSDNIFTRDRISQIHDIEWLIANMSDFRDFCYLDFRTCNCFPLNSLLTYFYPTLTSDKRLLADGRGFEQLDVDSALKWALSSSPKAYWFTDGRINSTFHQSLLLRSEIIFGGPLKGYQYINDRKAEQKEKFLKFAVTLRDYLSKASTSKVKVLYGGTDIYDYEVHEVYWNDLRLSIFSVAFIVIFVFILTSFSLWLTFWGIVTILLSFPLAFFFYRVVFNIVDVGLLNGVAAFVIVGIGVDDIFVFINTFRQARHIDDILKRIRHTVVTAGKATLFTSFTTAAAFAANISSAIPAVHQFGLFMTLIVTSCWVLVLLLMPPVIIIWHQWFGCCERNCYSCCWRCKVKNSLRLPENVLNFLEHHEANHSDNGRIQRDAVQEVEEDEEEDVALLQFEESIVNDGVLCLDGTSTDDDPLLQLEEEIRSETRKAEVDRKEGCNLNEWFQGVLYYYVALPVIKARVAIAVIFFGLLVISIGCFSQLHYATKPLKLFRPDTNLQMLLDLMANYTNSGLSCDDCSGYNKPPSESATYPTAPPELTDRFTTPFDLASRSIPPSAFYSTMASTQPRSTSGTTNRITSRGGSSSTRSRSPGFSITSRTSSGRSSEVLFSSSSSSTTAATTKLQAPTIPSATPPTVPYHNQTLNPCVGNQCDNIQDHPPLEPGITVYVVFGIKGINATSDDSGHVLPEKGTTVFDDEFYAYYQFASLNASELCRICKAINEASDLVLPNTSQCWPGNAGGMFESLLSNDEECRDVPKVYLDEKGTWRRSQLLMGYDNKGIRWLSFSFRATTYKGQSSFGAYEKYQQWELLIKNLVQSLPETSPLRSMYQTSEFWKQVMMEIVAVSSAIYGLVLSMLICILAVGVFTGHGLLLLITIMTMIGLVFLVLAIFFWAGWELGAIESISLSILVGSSVDYCVHIVEGYLLAGKSQPSMDNQSVRKWRTSVAVSHIGTSVVSSALTTIMAAIPLTQTILVPFSRFGQIFAINTAVSIFYALTACVAFLSLMAPPRFTNSFRSAGIMVLVMAAGTGLLFLILFIISRCGVSIPAPNGDELFPV